LKQSVPVAYNAGVGKVIVVSLSRQVLTAYQDGNAILTTFVATGRPQLPTPPGVYHIFARYSPYKMISPWPYGSPYWYPSAWTSFAMEFAAGDRKSTRLNSSHRTISYAVFCLKKKIHYRPFRPIIPRLRVARKLHRERPGDPPVASNAP